MSKSRSKRSALKHGANTQEVMLWSEKYEDFEALRAGLAEEWFPDGKTEEYEVAVLLDLLWRRRRLSRYEQIKMQKRLDVVRKANQTSRDIENLRGSVSEFNEAKTREQVDAILWLFSPLYRNTIHYRWPLREGDDPNTWGPRIASGLSAWIAPVRHEEADEFIEAVDLVSFDQDLTRIERLDAMIDRTIKRLMQLKSMKQMYRRLEPKLINIPAPKDVPVQDSPETAPQNDLDSPVPGALGDPADQLLAPATATGNALGVRT
jgi:hypothetical protein